MLVDGDFQLCQSNAILRYLGRKHGKMNLNIYIYEINIQYKQHTKFGNVHISDSSFDSHYETTGKTITLNFLTQNLSYLSLLVSKALHSYNYFSKI